MIVVRRAAILAACLGLVAGCGRQPGQSGTASTQQTGTAESPGGHPEAAQPPELKTTAEALAKEAIADPTAAEAKYKGKVVEVDGQVAFANKIVGDNRMFSLTGAKKQPTDAVSRDVMCTPRPDQQDRAWGLGRGQKVKVVGRVTGVNTFGVSLSDCTVAEEGPNPTQTVSAEQLAADYAKNPLAAEKKYLAGEKYAKEIIITGTVADLKTKNDFYVVRLAGSGPVAVDCTVKKEDWESLKKGEKVTIKGDLSFAYDAKANAVVVETAFVLKKG